MVMECGKKVLIAFCLSVILIDSVFKIATKSFFKNYVPLEECKKISYYTEVSSVKSDRESFDVSITLTLLINQVFKFVNFLYISFNSLASYHQKRRKASEKGS